MSSGGEQHSSSLGGFDIVDISPVEGDATKTESSGLHFHVKPQCPLCGSCFSDLICAKCVNSGHFVAVGSGKTVKSYTYEEITLEIAKKRAEIMRLNEKICSRIAQKKSHTETSISESNLQIQSLRHSILYHKSVLLEKKRRQCRIREQLQLIVSYLHNLNKSHEKISKHAILCGQRHAKLMDQLRSLGRQVVRVRNRCLSELLTVFFPITLSLSCNIPDQLLGIPLHIDKEMILTGPEPTPSSQTVLAYCSILARTSAIIMGLWLPKQVRQTLCLTGTFSSKCPRRDELGSVYLSLSEAVNMLCSYCGIVPANIQGTQSPVLNPLAGLYSLSIKARHNEQPYREFDAPYVLSLGHTAEKPISSLTEDVPADAVETGEEVLETYAEPTLEAETDLQLRLSTQVTADTSSELDSKEVDSNESMPSDLSCWEVVDVDENVDTSQNLEPSVLAEPLSSVWRIANEWVGSRYTDTK